jgi:hypothetical protein
MHAKVPGTSRMARLFDPRHQRSADHFTQSPLTGAIRGTTDPGKATCAALKIDQLEQDMAQVAAFGVETLLRGKLLPLAIVGHMRDELDDSVGR